MQLKGTLGLCNLPALRPWAQLGLTRSRLFIDKAVILMWSGYFILWDILSRGSQKPQWKPSSENVKSQSIDPAPVHWSKGALNVKQTWHQVVMDITHCNGDPFFDSDRLQPRSVCHLATSSSTRCDKCNQPAEGALLWAGPSTEILTDNDTAFRSSLLKAFLDEWRIWLRFRCAHVPSGNGIVEQCHRTVKKDYCQKAVYHTGNSILVQHHAKGWHVLCYNTSQYGLSVPHTAERNQWNIGADTQSTVGCLQTEWPSVGKDSTWMMYHKI